MEQPKQPTRFYHAASRFCIRMMFFVSGTLLLFSCKPTTAPLPVQLKGSWKSSYNDIRVIESWHQKNDTLIGTTVWNLDRKQRVDHLRMYFKGPTLFYTIKVPGKRLVVFQCDASQNDTLIFANEQNDYPKRIVYVRPKGKKMRTWIDNGPGDPNRIFFPFEKIRK